MSGPYSLFLALLGLIVMVGGLIWLWRLSHPEESDKETTDGDRLIHAGFGEYNTEGMVSFRGIALLVFGIVLILVGFIF